MRTCSKCGKEKPLSEFSRNRTMKDGLQSQCRPCCAESTNEWRRKNPERVRAAQKAWRDANRDKVRAQEERNRLKYPERHRRYQLSSKYGLTLEQYNEILDAQQGRCALCESSEPGGRGNFHVDHDHLCCPGKKTCGECIRGLVCNGCNIGMGRLGDSMEGVMRAMWYLQRASGDTELADLLRLIDLHLGHETRRGELELPAR